MPGCIEPDERGWIYSATTAVWIGVSEDRDEFFVVDAKSGERILSDQEQVQALETEVASLREELAEYTQT